MRRPIDLGDDHVIRFAIDSRSDLRFYILGHPRPDGQGSCAGSGRVLNPDQERPADGRAYWTIESEEPLTLSPSLLCTACGDHGWVRNGEWVPA
jgi:hypothetical protein